MMQPRAARVEHAVYGYARVHSSGGSTAPAQHDPTSQLASSASRWPGFGGYSARSRSAVGQSWVTDLRARPGKAQPGEARGLDPPARRSVAAAARAHPPVEARSQQLALLSALGRLRSVFTVAHCGQAASPSGCSAFRQAAFPSGSP
jgi:hypothetical protein